MLRPRLLGYGALLVLMMSIFAITVTSLSKVSLDVARDRNVLFREVNGGNIENVYIVRIFNKSQEERSFILTIEGHPQMRMDLQENRLRLDANEHLQLPVNVQLDPQYMDGTNIPVEFRIIAVDDADITAEAESRFMGPRLR